MTCGIWFKHKVLWLVLATVIRTDTRDCRCQNSKLLEERSGSSSTVGGKELSTFPVDILHWDRVKTEDEWTEWPLTIHLIHQVICVLMCFIVQQRCSSKWHAIKLHHYDAFPHSSNHNLWAFCHLADHRQRFQARSWSASRWWVGFSLYQIGTALEVDSSALCLYWYITYCLFAWILVLNLWFIQLYRNWWLGIINSCSRSISFFFKHTNKMHLSDHPLRLLKIS